MCACMQAVRFFILYINEIKSILDRSQDFSPNGKTLHSVLQGPHYLMQRGCKQCNYNNMKPVTWKESPLSLWYFFINDLIPDLKYFKRARRPVF